MVILWCVCGGEWVLRVEGRMVRILGGVDELVLENDEKNDLS